MAFEHLFNDAFIPVCSPAMAASIARADDLLDVKLLQSMMRPKAWAIWFASVGLEMPLAPKEFYLSNSALCYQAAIDDLGVAMAQQADIAEDLKQGRLVVPVKHVARTPEGYYLVCDPTKADSYPVRTFREWLRICR